MSLTCACIFMGVFFACMGASVCMLAVTAPPPSERHDSAISNVINLASLSLSDYTAHWSILAGCYLTPGLNIRSTDEGCNRMTFSQYDNHLRKYHSVQKYTIPPTIISYNEL